MAASRPNCVKWSVRPQVSFALNTLRYIHANPKAAGICKGFYHRYSNYGSYADLADDGLTEWHPAFFSLGESLDECAVRYRRFCMWYQMKKKHGGRRSQWGRRALPDVSRQKRQRKTRAQLDAGQLPLSQARWCQVWPEELLPRSALAGYGSTRYNKSPTVSYRPIGQLISAPAGEFSSLAASSSRSKRFWC